MDNILHKFPIWDDVRTFEGHPWRGKINIITGGFPCQDISAAGSGKGLRGKKSSLWFEMCRIVCEIRPQYMFAENSPLLAHRGLHTVLSNLAEAGYNVEWDVFSAQETGAPHRRERMFILATDSNSTRQQSNVSCRIESQISLPSSKSYMADSNSAWELQSERTLEKQWGWSPYSSKQIRSKNWSVEPNVDRVVNGMAHRVDRLTALGNGQVPIVAANAFIELFNRLHKRY